MKSEPLPLNWPKKKTRELQPGDTVYHPHRKKAVVAQVETEPSCSVAKVITQDPKEWFFAGVEAEHSTAPLPTTKLW